MIGVSIVGFCIGLLCGARVIGAAVGETDGGGERVGFIVTDVGFGDNVGTNDGRLVGTILGFVDGDGLSSIAGFADGETVGSAVGTSEMGGSVGLLDGRLVGRRVGAVIGRVVGRIAGAAVVEVEKGVGVINVGADWGDCCGATKNGDAESRSNRYSIDELFALKNVINQLRDKSERTIGPYCHKQNKQCLYQGNPCH